ncbi:MAG: hypothetical protein U0324_28510 [Polyangiales bacterium]
MLSALGRYADANAVGDLAGRWINAVRWHREDILDELMAAEQERNELDVDDSVRRFYGRILNWRWVLAVWGRDAIVGRINHPPSKSDRIAFEIHRRRLPIRVARANAYWQAGDAGAGLELLRNFAIPPWALLHERAEFAVALARCATASGDAALAIDRVTAILPDIERGLGAESHLAAQLRFERGEAHLARGTYAQARADYEAALAALRGGDLTDHPDRWIAELALSTLPSRTDLAAAEPAMERLAARLRAGHPLLTRWQERLDAARSRVARNT